MKLYLVPAEKLEKLLEKVGYTIVAKEVENTSKEKVTVWVNPKENDNFFAEVY